MATKGDFGIILDNGYDATAESNNISATDAFNPNPVQVQNTAVAQFARGIRVPKFGWNGYRKTAQTPTLHQLLAQNVAGIGSANDSEYVITAMFGNNASPVMGDVAFLFDGRVLSYQDKPTPQDILKFAAQFSPAGKRGGFGNVIGIQAATTTGTIVLGPYDRGAAANAGTLVGGVAHLQCVTPSALQATGTITVTGTLASDGDTVVVNGTTYTLKSALTPTAGQVLIGATTAATAANLYAAMIGSVTGSGTLYAAGTTKVTNTGASGIIITKSALVFTLTAALGGTAGNSLTLTSAGGANKPTVSGATLTGGTAGDSYVCTLASAVTSGGSYTTHWTTTSTLQAFGAERNEIAVGTTINRFIKFTATTGGSTSKPAFSVAFLGYYQQ